MFEKWKFEYIIQKTSYKMISILIALCLRLSEFCISPNSHTSPVYIDNFDIPFESCEISDFQNIEIKTTYSAIKNYNHRTLRLDNQLKFTINDVTSGDILTKLDIIDSIVTLNIHPNTPSSTIDGDIRINKINGAQLIINNGSFKMNPQKLIRFIHTNDIHCAYIEDPNSSTIGLSKFVSYVNFQKKNAKENGYSVFSVDCGDFNQGLPLCNVNNGSVGHEALKLAKYDAFTLGNHEWDYGHHNMYVRYSDYLKNKNPLVVSNIVDSSSNEKMEFTPYIIKEINAFGTDENTDNDDFKLKVGILGMITPYTNVTTNPLEVKDVFFDPDIVSVSKKYVKILRENEKCDVVVLICHLGYESLELTSNMLAESFDGIDVIIDGHSHTTLKEGAVRLNNDYTTLIAQTGSSLKNIGVVDIVVDSITKKVVGKRAKLLNYSDIISMNIEDNKEMSDFLYQKEKEVEEFTKVVIGKTLIDLECVREIIRKNGQSKMAYLTTTAFLNTATEADFAIANSGGIRSSIKKGDVTWGDVVSVLPFGNQLVVLNISGSQLHYLLRYGTRLYNKEEFGGFPTFSGISFTLNLDLEWESEERITDMKIVGKDGMKSEPIIIDNNHFYKLVTTDFLYFGGDGYQSIVGIPKLNQYSTELNSVIDLIKSLPGAMITGEESFFKYSRINEIGTARVASKYNNKKGSVSNVIYDNTVEINSGILNMLDFKLPNADNDDNPKSFYNFTAKAKSILSPNLKSFESVLNSDSKDLGYVGKDGVFIAGNNKELLVSNSINSEGESLSQISIGKIRSCSFFNKLNDQGQCKIDIAFVTIFALMCLYLVIVIVLIVVLVIVVKSKKGNSNAGEIRDEDEDEKKNNLLPQDQL